MNEERPRTAWQDDGRTGFMAEASRILASSLDYPTTLRNVAAIAVPQVADWCAVDLLEDGVLTRVAVEHVDSGKVALVREIEEKYPADPDATFGVPQVVRSGRPEYARVIPASLLAAAARDDAHHAMLEALDLHSYVVAPLLSRDQILGAITLVYAESGREYEDDDIAFVEDLARRAGTAIDNARLVRELIAEREQSAEQALELEGQADELQAQAAELQQQAAGMELLNAELTAADARLRGIIDSALDAIVTVDTASVIIQWNAPAERIFGWSAQDAVGRKLSETIIPEEHRDAHDHGMKRYLTTGETRILNRRIEITALHRDGRTFPVELTVASSQTGQNTIFSAFIRDLTEQKRAESRIAAVHDVTRVLAESRTLDEAAPRVLRAIGERLGWVAGMFWASEPGSERVRIVGRWHAEGDHLAGFVRSTNESTFTRATGLPGRVWASGDAVWIEDVVRDPDFPRADAALRAGLHSAFAFPVRVGADVLGVIELFYQEALPPDPGLLHAAEVIGTDIGESVRRVRAEEERDRALALAQSRSRRRTGMG